MLHLCQPSVTSHPRRQPWRSWCRRPGNVCSSPWSGFRPTGKVISLPSLFLKAYVYFCGRYNGAFIWKSRGRYVWEVCNTFLTYVRMLSDNTTSKVHSYRTNAHTHTHTRSRLGTPKHAWEVKQWTHLWSVNVCQFGFILTYIGPCIVIYFYSKTNQMYQYIKLFYFGMTLHVSDGLSVHHQEFKAVHTATKQILLSAC